MCCVRGKQIQKSPKWLNSDSTDRWKLKKWLERKIEGINVELFYGLAMASLSSCMGDGWGLTKYNACFEAKAKPNIIFLKSNLSSHFSSFSSMHPPSLIHYLNMYAQHHLNLTVLSFSFLCINIYIYIMPFFFFFYVLAG